MGNMNCINVWPSYIELCCAVGFKEMSINLTDYVIPVLFCFSTDLFLTVIKNRNINLECLLVSVKQNKKV